MNTEYAILLTRNLNRNLRETMEVMELTPPQQQIVQLYRVPNSWATLSRLREGRFTPPKLPLIRFHTSN
ncbi:hypothetical protein TorRG33x02_131120 [Trema orientale]|uniref:Uncharacterized protein n=1 Tax=Trema orientale TaxID=63057 RepID=A0A2P5EZX8_TREOI|nr:hypothetical protein TorRG33x02_131120 [Trema orientale]